MDSIPVPKSYNFMSVNSDGNPKGSGKPKVCNLDGAILVDQQVGRLQVSVQDSSGVAENNGLKTSNSHRTLFNLCQPDIVGRSRT